MSVQVEEEPDGLVSVRVTGRVVYNEWEKAQQAIAGFLASRSAKISLLVDGRGFSGWGPGRWDDLWFQNEHDEQIQRIALVVDEEWLDRALLFAGKGLRKVEIEAFLPDKLEEARTWASAALVARHWQGEKAEHPHG